MCVWGGGGGRGEGRGEQLFQNCFWHSFVKGSSLKGNNLLIKLGLQESKPEVINIVAVLKWQTITKTYLYSVDPLKLHFYIVKHYFLISAQKHRLWGRVRTASPRRF